MGVKQERNRLGENAAVALSIALGAGIAGGGIATAETKKEPQPITIPGEMPYFTSQQIIIDFDSSPFLPTTNPEQNPEVDAVYEEFKKQKEELEAKKYELPLEVWSDFIDLDSNPSMNGLFEKVSRDPEQYIEIVDPLGYGEHYFPNSHLYFIYADKYDDKDKDLRQQWTIKIIVEDSNEAQIQATVGVLIDRNLGVYDGDESQIARYSQIPANYLAMISDLVFNVPEQMVQNEKWNMDPNSNILSPNFDRIYIDSDGFEYKQRIRPNNVVTFSSLHPLP